MMIWLLWIGLAVVVTYIAAAALFGTWPFTSVAFPFGK